MFTIYDLHTLKDVLEKAGKTVTNYTGWSLECDGFIWGMISDMVYQGDKPMNKWQMKEYLKPKKT